MKHLQILISKLSVISLLSIFATSSALAGDAGTMTYTIASVNSIPTLSGSMLIVLSLLLFVVAFKVSRQKKSTMNKLFVTMLGVTALSIGSSGGIKLVADVDASNPVQFLNLITSTTGEVPIVIGLNTFENPNAGTLTITGITPPDNSSCENGITPPPVMCSVSLELPQSAQCQLTCTQFASDIRLKQDIKYITRLENGLKLYSFRYIPSYTTNATSYVGVMAQDLLQDSRYKNAVHIMDNDFYAVDYNALGLKMVTLDQWQESPANIYKL